MIVKNLENIDFDEIIDCFLMAFKNYFVEMPTNVDFYQKRWKYANVDLKFSYGMFDDEKLVGFIINGIDIRNGILTAYNTGTGVISDYRQSGIVNKIYDYAIPKLKSCGIKKCSLEVITANKIAIKSYENIGFKIIRTLKCFKGHLNSPTTNVNLIEKKISEVDFKNLANHEYYSWDNHKNSISKNPDYRFFQIENNNKIDSYFIINKDNGYLAQFEVFDSSNSNWNDLFYGIQSISKTIKINNIDSEFNEKIEFLKSLGLENTIDQYEMEMFI